MHKEKSLKNKDLWFTCPKCGTDYNEDLEEVFRPEDIKGSIEWAYSPTSDENRWDALEKVRLRDIYEHLDEQELVVCDVENIGSTLTGVWKGNYENKKCKS